MRILTRTALSLLVLAPTVTAGDEQVWKVWERELHRQCPANHVEWICFDCYDELLGAFSQTLSLSTRQKVEKIADYSHRCANETMGFSCEMAVNLDAFNRLKLMKQFVSFGCKRYKCSEPALCTSPPSKVEKDPPNR